MTKLAERLDKALASIKDRVGGLIDIAIILGTGLGGVAEAMANPIVIPYSEIDAFPRSTVASHAGKLLIGTIAGRRVAIMQGRFHFYEGWQADDVKLPIYLFKRLGVKTLIATNAAGGLNDDFTPGDIMLITDHINMIGVNPLVGENDEKIGPRFPDMSNAYDRELLVVAREIARQAKQRIQEGVYAAVIGPSLETSAERRFLRLIGGDAVGMSTIPEVIAAKHCGMKVLAFSIITNVATGGPDQKADTLEEIIKNAQTGGANLAALLPKLVAAV
ncbi:MAG TPA: purine-nucleoside phosphorylase [Magnetospirillaceae bacterium]|jgi:purine-nucleoside phosphorylase